MAAMHQWSQVAAAGLIVPVEELLLMNMVPLCQDEEDDEW